MTGDTGLLRAMLLLAPLSMTLACAVPNDHALAATFSPTRRLAAVVFFMDGPSLEPLQIGVKVVPATRMDWVDDANRACGYYAGQSSARNHVAMSEHLRLHWESDSTLVVESDSTLKVARATTPPGMHDVTCR